MQRDRFNDKLFDKKPGFAPRDLRISMAEKTEVGSPKKYMAERRFSPRKMTMLTKLF